MRRLISAVGISFLLAIAACGDKSDAEVSGKWIGGGTGDSIYLDLQQSGEVVTGTACEKPGQDCYPIKDGKFAGDTLTFSYAFNSYTVTATLTLTLSASGKTLSGNYHSTKCNCDIAVSVTSQ